MMFARPIAVAAAVAAVCLPLTAQTWKPSGTPAGHPDFQGVWSNNTVTPFARPKALAGTEYLSDEEIKVLEQRQP